MGCLLVGVDGIVVFFVLFGVVSWEVVWVVCVVLFVCYWCIGLDVDDCWCIGSLFGDWSGGEYVWWDVVLCDCW